MSTKRISINKITLDDEIMPRDQINSKYVDDLAKDIKRGDKIPPGDAFDDGNKLILVNGYHRRAALIEAGHKTIEVLIHKGTKRDAILFSCSVNAKHGLRRTNEDKKKAVLKMLADSKWRKWTDGKIAKHCAVSQPFVSTLRRELTQNGFESPSKRLGADGRPIETKDIGKIPAGSESQLQADPKEGSIPVVMKADKNSLPPKGKGKRKKHNGGTDDESGQDKPNPTPDSSVIIGEAKKLIHELEDGLRAMDGLLLDEGKIHKSKEKDLQKQWERIMPLWSKFVTHMSLNFDWIP